MTGCEDYARRTLTCDLLELVFRFRLLTYSQKTKNQKANQVLHQTVFFCFVTLDIYRLLLNALRF